MSIEVSVSFAVELRDDDMFIYNMMGIAVRPKSPPVTNPDKYHLVQPPEVGDA